MFFKRRKPYVPETDYVPSQATVPPMADYCGNFVSPAALRKTSTKKREEFIKKTISDTKQLVLQRADRGYTTCYINQYEDDLRKAIFDYFTSYGYKVKKIRGDEIEIAW